MGLEYPPILTVQRELYDRPRGYERFREYLRVMVDPETKDLKLPLVAMNPMGKDHARACDRATVFAALFGDDAARQFGYRPLGFSPRAGLALAAAGL